MNIKFPVIIYLDGIFSVDNGELLKFMKISFTKDNTMICRECKRHPEPGWIIDSTGQFIELNPMRKRREWARPFCLLWNLVLSEYAVVEGRSITIGELKRITKPIKDNFPEAPLAEDFRLFLTRYKDSMVLTGEMLVAWPI